MASRIQFNTHSWRNKACLKWITYYTNPFFKTPYILNALGGAQGGIHLKDRLGLNKGLVLNIGLQIKELKKDILLFPKMGNQVKYHS